MKSKLKSVRMGSKSAASPQSKTTQIKAKVRQESGLPLIAFFPEGEENGVAEELVDLSKAEYAALKHAAAPSGSGVAWFMVNAALEKIGFPGSDMVKKWPHTRTGRSALLDLEDSINGASALLDLLGERYIKQADEDGEGGRGSGLDDIVQIIVGNLSGDFTAVIKEREAMTTRGGDQIAKAAA